MAVSSEDGGPIVPPHPQFLLTHTQDPLLFDLGVLGGLTPLPPPVHEGRGEADQGGGEDEVPHDAHELLVRAGAGVLELLVLSGSGEVVGLGGEEHARPELLHVLLVVVGHLLGGHVRRKLLDLVLVLGDDGSHVVERDRVGDGRDVASVLVRELVGHVLLHDVVEAELGGGAHLHAEDVAAEGVVDLADLLVDKLLRERRRVVAGGVRLATERRNRPGEGRCAEVHRHFLDGNNNKVQKL
eukprot:381635_1